MQLRILRHALGLWHAGRRAYRNHYSATPGSPLHTDCLDLVARGLMQRGPGDMMTGGRDIFTVTPTGMDAARWP